MNNLLHDPLFAWSDLQDRRSHGSLPEVLATLASDNGDVVGFVDLQAHQQHPWHAFLVQVAAGIR